MTTQHKALELADWLAGMVCIHPQVSEDDLGGYATECDQKVDEGAATVRAQHALIVQMREALNSLDGLRGPFPPSDEEIGAAWDKAGKTIAAADKYLGEKQ